MSLASTLRAVGATECSCLGAPRELRMLWGPDPALCRVQRLSFLYLGAGGSPCPLLSSQGRDSLSTRLAQQQDRSSPGRGWCFLSCCAG